MCWILTLTTSTSTTIIGVYSDPKFVMYFDDFEQIRDDEYVSYQSTTKAFDKDPCGIYFYTLKKYIIIHD